MNQRYKIFFTAIIVFFLQNIYAQNSTRLLNAATSSNGNYIYIFQGDEIIESNTGAALDYYVIERLPFVLDKLKEKENEAKRIGIAKPVQTLNELRSYFSAQYIAEMQKTLKLKSENEVVNFFKEHKDPNDFSLYYLFMETRLALGHIYLDKDVKQGEAYTYIVKRVNKNKTEQTVGYSFVESKAGNYLLPYLKPKLFAISTQDSAVSFTWKLPISQNIINTIPKPKNKITDDVNNLTQRIAFEPYTLRANVFIKTNNAFEYAEKLLPTVNFTADTITYSYTKKCNPEEAVIAYTQIEDEVYNKGISSDTAFGLALEKSMLPIVSTARTTAVENGIQVSWNPLPAKPYISGVEILRYNSQDKLDTIAMLNSIDSNFTDYKIEVGQTYRYKIKALYIPELKMQQELPAEAIGTFTKFAKLKPIFNLSASHQSKNILLQWDWKDAQGFFGYYVYRGTNENNLTLIAGPIKTKSYIDSAASLSGKNEYYYTVAVQNLAQDMSEKSNIVKISPNRKTEIAHPTSINFFYANGSVTLNWNDVRQQDETVESFMVLKKRKEDKTFKLFANTLATSLTDSSVETGVTYEYKVASINFKKDTSTYSESYFFAIAKQAVDVITVFYARNIQGGIELSLPATFFSDRKMYNIYKRESSNPTFNKLASIDANTFSYIDKAVKANTTYVYALTVVAIDGREGERSKSVSVKKD